MLHALIYHGSFELNFARLSAGATSYVATDGTVCAVESRPVAVGGLVIG